MYNNVWSVERNDDEIIAVFIIIGA